VHLNISEKILNNEWSTYPPLLHVLCDCLFVTTGLPLTKIYIFLPLLILGVGIPVILFLIICQITSWRQAILVSPLFIFLVPRTTEMYAHSQFPEILALFLSLLFILILFQKKYLASLLLIISVLLAHHLTAIPLIIAFFIYNILTNRKKVLYIIASILFIGIFITLVWPNYFIVLRYDVINIISHNHAGGIINVKNLFDLWTINKVFSLFIISGIFSSLLFFKKKKKPEIIFFLLWGFVLLILSQIDFGVIHLSNRLARQMLIPIILLITVGFLFILEKISNKKIKAFIISIIFILFLTNLLTVINKDYSFVNYERIKNDDLQAFDYLQKNTDPNSHILMPGGSLTWYGYLGKRNFILLNDKNNSDQQKYWNLIHGTEISEAEIKYLNIEYVYQVTPQSFINVPYENIEFNENDLLKTNLWEKVFENSRVKIYKFIPKL